MGRLEVHSILLDPVPRELVTQRFPPHQIAECVRKQACTSRSFDVYRKWPLHFSMYVVVRVHAQPEI